ncbi:MAG TPA: DUF4199 domain-containing protein [Chitinophagaceae bacterium]|nr:DUF4199 domain-containing protein [Chitinophagaceae bacterium]
MKNSNPALRYGLIGAAILVAAGIVFQLYTLSYLKKTVRDPESFSYTTSMIIGLVSLVIVAGVFIFCIVATQRQYRKLNPEYSYRDLVGQGLWVTLVLVLVSTAASYLYNYVVSPEMKARTLELTRQLYDVMDLSAEQKEKIMSAIENRNPVRELLTSVGLMLLLGMIVSLISAMVLNRRNITPNQMR